MKKRIILFKLKNEKNPVKVLNEHYKKCKAKGYVAFSTDLAIGEKWINDFEEIIFVCKMSNACVYCVKAQVNAIKKAEEAFIPMEWSEYLPNAYSNESRKTWLLLSDFSLMNTSELKNLKTKKGIAFNYLLSVKRWNRIYCWK